MPRYTIADGRCIVRDGVMVATLHKIGNDSEGYTLDPCEADTLARDVVSGLNWLEAIREQYRQDVKRGE